MDQSPDRIRSTADDQEGDLSGNRAVSLSEELVRYQRLAILGSNDGLWVWEVGAAYPYFSDRFAEILGYSPEEFEDVIVRYNEILHPADVDHAWAAINDHLQHGRPYDVRYRLQAKSGEYVWLHARGKTFEATESHPRCMAGSIQDISELVDAEESLRALKAAVDERVRLRTEALLLSNFELKDEILQRRAALKELSTSERKYQDLYNHSPDMYASVDPTTNTITECNQTLLTTLGYEAEDLIGKHVFELYHAECYDEMQAVRSTLEQTGEVNDARLTLRCKDGQPIYVSLRVRPVRDADGKVLHRRAAWRDISQQVRTERKLREQESLLTHVTRVATMGEMATGMAHELNQPLQSISSYAQGCIHRLQTGHVDADQLTVAAQTIVAEAQRASDIIGRLRSMVKGGEVTLCDVNVNDIAKETVLLLEAELKKYKVAVCTDLAELPSVRADAVQLQQVIVNLIHNAIGAMVKEESPQREILLRTYMPDEQHVALSVADTGPGIPPEAMPQLFNAFFTTRSEGMGMGLSICRTIAESHDGTISASNGPQGGAVFTLTLPASTKQ